MVNLGKMSGLGVKSGSGRLDFGEIEGLEGQIFGKFADFEVFLDSLLKR